MDQTLQARLIGATVLVALAVLLIPELLSGRKTVEPSVEAGAVAKGTRSFTIELGSPGGPTSIPAAPAPSAITPPTRMPVSPAGEPVPAGTPGAATSLEPSPAAPASPPEHSPPAGRVPEPEPPVAQASPTAASPVAATSKAGGWVVQVGAFGSADAARRLADELAAAGFEAHLAPVARSGRTLHRVRVGPVAERAAADQLAERLKGRGLPSSVFEND